MSAFDKVIGYETIKNELLQICDMIHKSVICLLMRLLHLVSFSLLPQGMNTDLPYSPPISLFQNGPMFSVTLLLPTQSLTDLSTIVTDKTRVSFLITASEAPELIRRQTLAQPATNE